jgi:hypothetical protein
VVASLLRRELTDGRQDTEGVAGQHDDVARLAIDHTGNLGVRDELNGVCTTCVLGNADIIVVGNTINGVVDDVLEDGTVTYGIKYLGLLLCGEVDSLGITSTFDVEDTGVGPDMFIVTNEKTVGVGREGCLAGTRETEEKGDIAIFDTNVGRRVQGELAEFDGLEVVHNGENTLLHLTSILSSEDDHLHTLEVNLDGGCRAHAFRKSVGRELAGVVNDEVRFPEVSEFSLGRAYQHIVHEESVVGTSTNDSYFDAIFRIPPCISVKDIDIITSVQVIDSTFTVNFEGV